jgi:hypothetical protein
MSDSDRYVAALAELATVTRERDEARVAAGAAVYWQDVQRDNADLKAQVVRLRQGRDEARVALSRAQQSLADYFVETTRLRAALEETVENHQLIIAAWADGGPRGVLAAIRAKAGLT